MKGIIDVMSLEEIAELYGPETTYSSIGYPQFIENILRVDTLINEAEQQCCGLRVQLRHKDPEGIKPYYILDVEINPLTGHVSIALRSDRGGGNSSHTGIDSIINDAEQDQPIEYALLRSVVLLLEREDYVDEAAMLMRILEGDGPIGRPRFKRRFRDALLQMYAVTPDYNQNELITGRAMEVGRYYAVCQIPPINDVIFEVIRFQEYCDLGGWQEQIWVRGFGDTGQLSIQINWLSESIYWDTKPNTKKSIVVHTDKDYKGKIFEISKEMFDELATFIDPEFDSTSDVRVNMPVWDKPLDTLTNCLERIRDSRHAYNREHYYEAIRFIFEHRDELTEEISITVPSSPSSWASTTKDSRWADIIEGTEANCGCGVHRVIKPKTELVLTN